MNKKHMEIALNCIYDIEMPAGMSLRSIMDGSVMMMSMDIRDYINGRINYDALAGNWKRLQCILDAHEREVESAINDNARMIARCNPQWYAHRAMFALLNGDAERCIQLACLAAEFFSVQWHVKQNGGDDNEFVVAVEAVDNGTPFDSSERIAVEDEKKYALLRIIDNDRQKSFNSAFGYMVELNNLAREENECIPNWEL